MNNFVDIVAKIHEWPFTIIAAIIGLGGSIYLFCLKRFCDASDIFRAAFTDTILNLTESDIPCFQVVRAFRGQHLGAIQVFRGRVPWLWRFGFDKATQTYRHNCDQCLEGGIFAEFASESTDYAKANRKALLESIHNLLSYAKNA